MEKAYELVITNAIIQDNKEVVEIAVSDGRIVNIGVSNKQNSGSSEFKNAKTIYDAAGHFLCSGFYESHIHLDKACILERCKIEEGNLEEAVEETGKAKKEFTQEDVYERASKVI